MVIESQSKAHHVTHLPGISESHSKTQPTASERARRKSRVRSGSISLRRTSRPGTSRKVSTFDQATPKQVSGGNTESHRRQSLTSPYDQALTNRVHKKVYPSKVYTPWYRRFVSFLPEDEMIDYQPWDEVQRTDEDIALQYFYGDEELGQNRPTDKEAKEKRRLALRRYNKMKELQESREQEQAPAATSQDDEPGRDHQMHDRMSIRSILAATKAKKNTMKQVFGPTNIEKIKMLPIVNFLAKLHLKKHRSFRVQRLKPNSKWKLLYNPSIIRKIKKCYAEYVREKIRSRFRRVINLVRCVQRFLNVISMMSGDTKIIFKEVQAFREAQERKEQERAKLAETSGLFNKKIIFDPNKYRFSQQLTLPSLVKLILTKPWFARSDEEVTHAVESLQIHRSFVEYPTMFQRRLARVAWLINVPPDKVIIREKHIAFDFYFLLSGKAKMTKLVGSPYVGEKAGFELVRHYRKDEVFGDESMSDPLCERQYSVISTDDCLLLSINVHDYLNMLMTNRDDEEAPDHIMFLSSLQFLQNFPMGKLIEEGEDNITLYYFRSGTLIAADIGSSVYVYVIKYGSSHVISEVLPPQSVVDEYKKSIGQPTTGPRVIEPRETLSQILTKLEKEKSKLAGNQMLRMRMQTHRERLLSGNWVKERLAEQEAKVKPVNQRDRRELQVELETIKKKASIMSRSLSIQPGSFGSRDASSYFALSHPRESVLTIQGQPADRYHSSIPSHGGIMSRLSSLPYDRRNSGESSEDQLDAGSSTSLRSVSFTIPEQLPRIPSSQFKHHVGTSIPVIKLVSKNLLPDGMVPSAGVEEEKLSQISDSSAKNPSVKKVELKGWQPQCSRWKHVKVMVKGDYIGHEWLDYNTGPFEPPTEKMSLISDGCEVILMKKCFLLKYMRKEW